MKFLIKLVFIFTVLFNNLLIDKSFAQINLMQSDSTIKWLEIRSDNFKLIFPDYLEAKAQYTLNLLEHYRPLVTASYQSQPKLLTIIIRPEMAAPNGFVTLAPRRSEWFNNASITPLVGSLEWFQSLAIHEYRHIVQYDYLSQGNTKWGYYLFGEGVLGFLINIVMPTWYFEGDAVWAETTLSNAGRGRSPRFSARFKALITSDQFPKYDDLLAGDYTTELPSYYVYGYFLVSRAYNIYGHDVWRKIAKEASRQPWNVYALYSAFKEITGKDFDEFYNDTLKELKVSWDEAPKDFKKKDPGPFNNQVYPISDNGEVYYFKKSLNSHWTLYNSKGVIREFNISPSLSKVDIKNSQFVFAQNIPHSRFLYKAYSDLFIYDIELDSLKKITNKKRYSHPKFNWDANKILAIDFGENDIFSTVILNQHGEVLKRISPELGHTFSEAIWVNENNIVAISIAPNGQKQLITYNLETNIIEKLTPSSRNNLYNINHSKNSIYFEADYQGKVNIFKLNLDTKNISQCTDEYISAFMPYVSDQLYYVYESNNGKRIKRSEINCIKEENGGNKLFDYSQYIGNTPSDNYTQSKPIEISNFDSLKKGNKLSKLHTENTSSLSPHSWSFIGDRGFQLSATSTNKLGNLSLNAYTGSSAEESTPYAGFALNYMKYYPIFGLQFDYANRNKEIAIGEKTQWSETKGILSVTLPYLYQNNLFGGIHLLRFESGLISVTENAYTSTTRLNDNELYTNSISLSSSYQKALTRNEIFPKWGALFTANYTDIAKKEDSETNYFTQVNTIFNTPGFTKNHGIEIKLTTERRPKNKRLYTLQQNYRPLIGYTLSRGHSLEFTPEFNKIVLEYALPLVYPKMGIGDWIYFTRIYAKIFNDHTSFLNSNNDFHALNSTGIEFIFDTNTLQKFPLSYGVRFLEVNKPEKKNHIEIFLATQFD